MGFNSFHYITCLELLSSQLDIGVLFLFCFTLHKYKDCGTTDTVQCEIVLFKRDIPLQLICAEAGTSISGLFDELLCIQVQAGLLPVLSAIHANYPTTVFKI